MKTVKLVKPADMGSLLVKKLVVMNADQTDKVFKLFGLDAEYDREDRCFFVTNETD